MREHHRRRHAAIALLTTSLVIAAAACGDDDDESTSTTAAAETTAAASETTAGSETTEAGSETTAGGTGEGAASVEAFCAAEPVAEAAANGEDPAAMESAFTALVAASPDEIRPAVEDVIANADAGPTSPEFAAAYSEMIGFVRDNCGFNDVEVGAINFAFTDLPSELDAGTTVLTLNNEGEDMHEIILMRKNDGVTETAEEILALPEEEADTKVTFAAAGFAVPGGSGHTVAELEPGDYFAVCFIPQGMTPEVFAQMEGPEDTTPPGVTLGAPHFTLGMLQEFTVG